MKTDNSKILPIVIINWNGFIDTKECISSLLAENSENIIIYLIDNGSKKEDVLAIQKHFSNNPKIKITFNPKNIGYTKAHNLILKELINEGYKYIFLLNNDTIVIPKSITFLKENFQNFNMDLVSCKMIKSQNHNLMDSAGHKMLSSGEIIPIGHNKNIEKYNIGFENIGASAGAGLYSTEMLKDIGIFDDYFETGYEDAELGLRAFVSGYKCYYKPEAEFYHKIGQSLKKVFDYKHALKTQVNIFYTYLKLVHWQIIVINIIPWILRLLLITLIGIFSFRFRYLKILYAALGRILFRDIKEIFIARKASKRLRRIPWWQLLKKQEFFLKNDIQNFYKFIIKGEKSHLENY
ncbi:MAG: hypothetical protein COW08_08760 [Ignavibacteriales bacterium CG12_big_fil_rev_8_21_14_0_65_30_8]|nr:MAG: hypothetical protein COW08_08760 [Ignavibacteriales bacterium CG12_big_fil_rev_8_21_14_0_65_30_8]